MKHTLLMLTAFAASTCSFADEWQKPVYTGAYLALTADSAVYVYNTEAKQFLGSGNDWGTHASLVDAADAQLFTVREKKNDSGEWDGANYTIENYSLSSELWQNMFITDNGNVYNDRREQEDYFFTFTALEGNTYQIKGSDLNPVWKASGDFSGYLLGNYTGYVNTKDNVATGTGVIYDLAGEDSNYEPGEFNTTWAFVSDKDYQAYISQIDTYEAAVELGELIEQAEKYGVTDLDAEKAVYANTSSTADQLEEASESVSKKLRAKMEEAVTPDNPLTVLTDECNDIEDWNNDINAETWNTQTWIAEGWTGFDGTTLNIWGANLEGEANMELADMPNGIYVVSMAAYSESMNGYVFANDNAKTVTAGAAGQVYSVTTNVTDGELDFGFGQDEPGKNWVALDNVTVTYYGNGAKAYKYWLNSLKDSSSELDDMVYQTALKDEYYAVLNKVDNAETDEEILAVIKEYEDVLAKIAASSMVYDRLEEAIDKADEIITNELCNNLYGDKLSDMKQEKEGVYEEHTLADDDVNKEAEQLETLCAEAEQYIWNVEKLNSELETAAGIYAEYEATATEAAKQDYNDFVAAYSSLKDKELTAEGVLALIDKLYEIEFNLSLKDEVASDDNPVDYSARIFNNGFNGVDGWTNEGWSTFANNTSWSDFGNEDGASSANEDGFYLNLWNGSAADCYQTVSNLPAGAYTLTFGAFAQQDGLEVYANDNSLKIPAGQDELYNYMHVYSINVIVGKEGTLKIGIRNTAGGEMWAMADEFHLTYKGTESEIMTGVGSISATTAKANGAYTLSGAKVSSDKAVKNGIIIKNGKKFLNK